MKNDIEEAVYYDEVSNEEILNLEPEPNTNQDNIEEASIDEVLQLTEYGGNLVKNENSYGTVAEYVDMDLKEISLKHKKQATEFVGKITKFILDFNDVELTIAHKNYIKQAAKFQLGHLQDLLELIDMNKMIVLNLARRINATQSEDYAVTNTYNSLVNQHIKLIKEVQNTYRGIPNVLKKMKADVLDSQETSQITQDEIITEDSGITQFSNQKHLIRRLLENKQKKDEGSNSDN